MSDQAILTKAISKAIAGGWDCFGNDKYPAERLAQGALGLLDLEETDFSLNDIIYNHDFAKHLWGTEMSDDIAITNPQRVPKWIAHLQQMVVSDNPIQYLGEHI